MDGIKLLKLDETTRTAVVAETAEALLAGGIVVFPTDTVYGLMIHATDAAQLARINALKKRPFDKPVAALVVVDAALIARMRELVGTLPGAEKLIPGALTVVAERSAWANVLPHPLMSLPYSRIGVRVPDHAILQEVLARCEGWLMATSANLEGRPTPPSLTEVTAQLSEASEIALAVDGGKCTAEPSAVVEISSTETRIMRTHPLLRG
jgi:L-threonylcarbamoyladenylate synthase